MWLWIKNLRCVSFDHNITPMVMELIKVRNCKCSMHFSYAMKKQKIRKCRMFQRSKRKGVILWIHMQLKIIRVGIFYTCYRCRLTSVGGGSTLHLIKMTLTLLNLTLTFLLLFTNVSDYHTNAIFFAAHVCLICKFRFLWVFCDAMYKLHSCVQCMCVCLLLTDLCHHITDKQKKKIPPPLHKYKNCFCCYCCWRCFCCRIVGWQQPQYL